MSEREPSKTAWGVAVLRAVHQIIDGEPKILDDPVSVHLLDRGVADWLRQNADRYQTPGARALRMHVLVRSRYAEDRLAAAVARGVRQFVILGAGFDTFAYRQPSWAAGLRVFEVDQPASQRQKRARLEAACIQPPANLTYVAIDFETTSIAAGLADSGFDPVQPAFIAWLGVMVYLRQEAVEAVFQFAAGLARGSEIVFTFSQPRAEGQLGRAGLTLADRAAKAGEPWRTHIAPEALADDLHELGFSVVTIPTVAELDARYTLQRADGLHAGRRQTLASAVV